ncbi:hypothetical protein GCM10017691_06210 [Pseudonocardia petroleophila]
MPPWDGGKVAFLQPGRAAGWYGRRVQRQYWFTDPARVGSAGEPLR